MDKRELRSAKILSGGDKGIYRALYKSMGYAKDDLTRPMIGIANSWNTLVPGHFNLNQVSEHVKWGIYRAGGTPVEFGVIGACDGVANGHEGMHFILSSREIICNLVDKGIPAREIIKTMEEPFGHMGGVAVLRGNLTPNTGISKPSAIDPALFQFSGKARVFDSEEEANRAILNKEIKPGDAVVIRYEGPKGGPGMREMYKAMKYLYGLGLNKATALITDGRFSGTSNGCFVGHISPEAAEGGPLAIVKDGDEIGIDLEGGTLHIHVSENEIQERFRGWTAPEPKFKRGYLELYARLASSAAEGAVIKTKSRQLRGKSV